MSHLQKLLLTFLFFYAALFVTGCKHKSQSPAISSDKILYIAFENEYTSLKTGESTQLHVLAYDKDNTAYDITGSVYLEESNSTVLSLSGITCSADTVGQSSIIASYAGLQAGKTITVSAQTRAASHTPNPFTDQYASAIPDDATIKEYDSRRFGVVTGLVQNQEEQPIAGVRISIKRHPEYGSVLTDEQGFFELATEASGFQVIDYQKQGHTPLQRKVKTHWNQIVRVDDVTMLEVDAKSTFIDLSQAGTQIHESSTINDSRGERSASIIFDGVSQANVVNPDGSSYILSKFNVRATEFTTPESMPATLPVSSAFTYCIDVTLDGVPNDAMVHFDNNITFFVDNFLEMPVGTIVPVGYYSRSKMKWIAMNNGIIVKLLDTNGDGIVDGLDIDGDDKADDLNENNQTDDEVTGLENNHRYKPEQTYTMFYSDHFTSFDPNYGPGNDDNDAPDPEPEDDDEPDCQADPFNSYVNPGDRSFHEDINIPGTDITLWYNSKDTQGYHLKLRLNTSDQNVGSIGSLFSLNIAGLSYKKLLQRFSGDKDFTYFWYRKDYNGNISTTPQITTFSIHHINQVYAVVSRSSSGSGGGVSLSAPSRELGAEHYFGYDLAGVEGVETFRTNNLINAAAYSPSKKFFVKLYPGINHKNIANGWNFNGIHSSVNELATLRNNSWNVYFRGVMRMPDAIDKSGKEYQYYGYRCKVNSYDSYIARKFLVDDNQNVYRVCKEGSHQYIKRFGANGTETVEYFIGGGTQAFEDGVTKADEIAFGDDIDFTMDNDGNIIITDTNNHKIYKQYITGQFSLLIGSEQGDADGKYYEAQLSSPTEPVTDSLGNIYFIDKGSKKIKKASNGEVVTLIGQVEGDTHNGDNGLASEATMPMPTQLTMDDNDNLYIAFGANSFYNTYNERIRMIAANGYIYPIAGENSSASPWYNNRSMQAKYATMNYLLKTMSMFVDLQGRLRVGPYIFSKTSSVIFDEETQLYSYQNGSTLKTFDTEYKHLKTIDTDTNTTLYSFTYTPSGKLKTITDRFEQTTEIEYSGDTATAIISPNGDRLTLEVDEQRNLASVTYPDGETQRFEYDENDLMTKMTQPNGNSFTHEYDEHGRIVNFLDEEGGKWTYGFTQDAASRSRTITKTSASGNTRVKTYTTTANGTKNMNQTDADGTVSTSSSDERTSTSQSCGIQTARVPYGSGGAIGSKTTTSYLDEASGSFTFNACTLTSTQKSYFDDNSTKVKTSLTKLMKGSNSYYCRYPTNYYTAQYFNTTTINTNYETGTTTITTPQNRTLISTFGPATQLTTKVETAGTLPVTYTYDDKGKVTSTTQGNRNTQYLYNDKNDLVTLVDADGIPTQYTYDSMHRVTSIQKAGQKVEYTYDANGNLASTTTPNQAIFEETANKINYPNTFKSPLGFTKSYTYTVDRELESITLPSGKKIEYTYNKTNLSRQTTPETTTNYTYGCGGLLTGASTDTGEAIDYNYDGLRRVTNIIYSGVLNETISYGNYNRLLDLPQELSYAGTSTTLTYDKDGLLTKSGDYTLNREADTGRVTDITEGNYKQEFTYNEYGELESKEESYQNNRLYKYDILQRTPSGKIETKVEQGISNKPTVYTYTYDQAGRLTGVQTNGIVTESYLYDHNGNRLEATVNNITTKASYTLEDQLEVYGQNTYRYDDDGYLEEKVIPDGTTAYEYGTLGELRKVVTPTKTIEYVHNANNQRVAKKVNGTITEKYLWADFTTLLAIYDSNDTLVQRFEYADARMPIAMTQGSDKYYLHYDQVGTLRAISDSSGAIIKEVTYDTYGNVLTDSNEAFTVLFGFAGGLYDPDTKLTRFGYRDYDAYTGKWTAKDPIGFSGGDSNLYGYVLGDPVNFVDPSGLDTKLCSRGLGSPTNPDKSIFNPPILTINAISKK